MIARQLHCDRTLAFVWFPEECAYVPADGYALAGELAELKMSVLPRRLPADHGQSSARRDGERPTRRRPSGARVDGAVRLVHLCSRAHGRHRPQSSASSPPIGASRSTSAPPICASSKAWRRTRPWRSRMLVWSSSSRPRRRTKSEFINSMSHEMRTPLNVIFGFLEMLGDQVPEEGEARSAIERIHRNAGHLLKLVSTPRSTSAAARPGACTLSVRDLRRRPRLRGPPARSSRLVSTQPGHLVRCFVDGDLGPMTTDRMGVDSRMPQQPGVRTLSSSPTRGRIGVRAAPFRS